MNKIALKKSVKCKRLTKSPDVRISLAQSGCLTWYRCSLELALTSCRHTPGASAACQQARHGLPEAGQTQGYCTAINLQQVHVTEAGNTPDLQITHKK